MLIAFLVYHAPVATPRFRASNDDFLPPRQFGDLSLEMLLFLALLARVATHESRCQKYPTHGLPGQQASYWLLPVERLPRENSRV